MKRFLVIGLIGGLSWLAVSCDLVTRIIPSVPEPQAKLEVGAGESSILVADSLIGGISKRLRARQSAQKKAVLGVLAGLFDAAYMKDSVHIEDLVPYLTTGAAKRARGQMAEIARPKLPVSIQSVERAVLSVENITVYYPSRKAALAAAPVRFDGLFSLRGDGAVRIQVEGTCYLIRQRGRWLVYGFDFKRAIDTPERKGKP